MTTGMLSINASLIAERTTFDCILPARVRRPFINFSFIKLYVSFLVKVFYPEDVSAYNEILIY